MFKQIRCFIHTSSLVATNCKPALADARYKISFCKSNQVGVNCVNWIPTLTGSKKHVNCWCFTTEYIIIWEKKFILFVTNFSNTHLSMLNISNKQQHMHVWKMFKGANIQMILISRLPASWEAAGFERWREKINLSEMVHRSMRPSSSDNICNLHNNAIIICLTFFNLCNSHLQHS